MTQRYMRTVIISSSREQVPRPSVESEVVVSVRVRPSLRDSRGVTSVLMLALLVVMVLSLGLGAVSIGPDVTVGVLAHRMGLIGQGAWSAVESLIVWDYRAPRVLLAALVGAALALVGAILQALVRNPLADPWVLGVSSGAGLGAVATVLLAAGAGAVTSRSAGAAAGAAVATIAVFLLARQDGRLTPVRLVLSGVALSFLWGAATNYLVLTSDADEVFGVLYFLMGSLTAATWADIPVIAIILFAGALHAWARARPLTALLAGQETATALGLNTSRIRTEFLISTSVLTGAVVAVSGGIGFVGLLVPHVARMLVGADHRRMLPVALLLGAAFLVLADTCARTIAAPIELPIGIVTAAVGAPFFLWLMRRESPARRAGVGR